MRHCRSPELADLVRLSVAGPSVVQLEWVALPALVGFRYVADCPVHQLFDVVLDLQYLAPLVQAALDAGVLWLALAPGSTRVPLCVPVSPAELGDTVVRCCHTSGPWSICGRQSTPANKPGESTYTFWLTYSARPRQPDACFDQVSPAVAALEPTEIAQIVHFLRHGYYLNGCWRLGRDRAGNGGLTVKLVHEQVETHRAQFDGLIV